MKFLTAHKGLAPLLIFTNLLVLVRIFCTHRLTFIFIPWNLFLAVLPLYFTYKLNNALRPRAAIIFLLLWLLFFPNAMYIVTDLFHLRERKGIPQWYDLLILFTAALNGLIVGFLSLKKTEVYLMRKVLRKYLAFVQLPIFVLCGYGIYLGRYLRWNSWDALVNPFSLLTDILQDVIHPFRNAECWMLSALFGTWMFIMYRYFRKLEVN